MRLELRLCGVRGLLSIRLAYIITNASYLPPACLQMLKSILNVILHGTSHPSKDFNTNVNGSRMGTIVDVIIRSAIAAENVQLKESVGR